MWDEQLEGSGPCFTALRYGYRGFGCPMAASAACCSPAADLNRTHVEYGSAPAFKGTANAFPTHVRHA